jgi:hypothetical protein
MGDVCAEKQIVNVRFKFKQGLVHNEYLLHLFELFSSYCSNAPKITNPAPHKLTGKVYSGIWFNTYSLPCFAPLYDLFYPDGKKIIPLNIGDLLTPLSLAYWIADDGCFCKSTRRVILATNCFSFDEVNLLSGVLTNKFHLKCSVNNSKNGYVINISSKSLFDLQELLKPHMPRMMQFKIGL